jgi:iron complex outermembrane receptor protein
MKLSYSKSFVYAPYIYQVENVTRSYLFYDKPTFVYALDPQRIHSWQLSVAGNNRSRSLNLEANLFYNRANNLIVPALADLKNDSHHHAVGLELRGSYHKPRFTADLNLTWTHVIKSSLKLPANGIEGEELLGDDENNNMPTVMANGVLAWKVIPSLKLHTHFLFESRQYSYFTDLRMELLAQAYNIKEREATMQGDEETAIEYFEKTEELSRSLNKKEEMPARFIINLGGEYTLGPVTFALNIHNLLNTRYNRSGINTNLIPQQGRWFLATIGVKI